MRQLTVRSRIPRARVRAQGLQLALRVAGDANVVRVQIQRMSGGRRGPLVAQAFRPPTSNPVRLRLAGRDLRRQPTPGRDRIEVAAGMSPTTLGAVATAPLRVVR